MSRKVIATKTKSLSTLPTIDYPFGMQATAGVLTAVTGFMLASETLLPYLPQCTQYAAPMSQACPPGEHKHFILPEHTELGSSTMASTRTATLI